MQLGDIPPWFPWNQGNQGGVSPSPCAQGLSDVEEIPEMSSDEDEAWEADDDESEADDDDD